ncbi:very short patch repair endonuclease [Paenibacillus sp. V4I7]|uniref:very short patch repair endonuclease n=1 Tax=Paenibacillus sp. V4I7 TaxID=3042307 RepID=UPI0027819E7F|nr:very short patch repair endonuclease [Paenibacillus sp. V4I7]MDQ0902757.1 DNA mismatch endonuclease (patch repair protein) [Paenibacillus sp. V4I7]
MTDRVSKETRSKMMKSVKSVSSLEKRISKALWNLGFRFRTNSPGLFGKPDISIKKYKIVIFIDSCFWHHCDIHGRIPTSNENYWIQKIERNKKRDIQVNNYYLEKGWHVLRVWEHEAKQNFEVAIDKIADYILSWKAKEIDRST